MGLDVNTTASNLLAASASRVNWSSLLWPNSMLPTASYTNPNSIIMQQLEMQNEVLKKLLETKEKAGVEISKKKHKKHKRNDRKRKRKAALKKIQAQVNLTIRYPC
jgi:hypothetical protein